MAKTTPITGDEPGSGVELPRGADRAVIAMKWVDNITLTERRARGLMWLGVSGKDGAYCRQSWLNGARENVWVPDYTGEGGGKRFPSGGHAGAALNFWWGLGRPLLTEGHVSFEPDWGKPNVRNLRAGAGNVAMGEL